MRVHRAELRHVRLPLRQPFRTATSATAVRDLVVLRLDTTAGTGWGECAALAAPTYTEEWVEGTVTVAERWLLPALVTADLGVVGSATATDPIGSAAAADPIGSATATDPIGSATAADPVGSAAGADPVGSAAAAVDAALALVAGHPMAKAMIEMAVVDAVLRAGGRSLAAALGSGRRAIPAGVVIGLAPTAADAVAEVSARVDEGYRAVKLKVQPGWDVEPVTAIRRRHPDLEVGVDANGSYHPGDAGHLGALVALDALGLAYIEQPFPAAAALAEHARLAERLATPVCLDESITSLDAATRAVAAGAAGVISVKPARLGGLAAARRLHDAGAAAGVPLRIGGMLEAGVGRAAAVAVGALDGFTITGDLSASDRYVAADLVSAPMPLVDGHLPVPDGPGLGVDVDEERLAAATVALRTVER